jgi:hypothetical protein
MAICGISECFEDALLRQMQRPPQNLLATSSRDFDFKLDDRNQMHFCRHMHFVEYLNNLMFVPEVWKCLGKHAFRQMRLSPQKLVATCSRDFDFKLDDWTQMHFCRHMHFVEYLNNLMSVFWSLKVSWKVCSQANATVFSKVGGDVFSRFRFQVGWLEPDAFLPTHLVGYLNSLVSVLEVWKCLGKYAFRQMLLSPQKLVATCSRDFDINLDDWNQTQFCQHIL